MAAAGRTHAGEPTPVTAHKHDARRVNIPTADAESFVEETVAAPKNVEWARRNLALDPQLVWRGKDGEADVLDVVTPPIYIQEKIDPRALVENLRRTAGRPEDEPELTLFQEFDDLGPFEAVEFYEHESKWSNRIILGDSLAVMSSLADRENLRGQVQAIYIDPPYGIKFGSNWQPRTDKRDVKDGNLADLAREAEQIRAFRDTWEDGLNSYLTYLRDRLTVARELLTESGSVFVQMGDDNVHPIRALLDETFGVENYISQIVFRKTTGKGGQYLDNTYDILLWFARDRAHLKYRALYEPRTILDDQNLRSVQTADGTRRRMTPDEANERVALPKGARAYRHNPITNQRPAQGGDLREYEFGGRVFRPGNGTFRTDKAGLDRLSWAGRLAPAGTNLSFLRYLDDFPFKPRSDIWDDTRQSGFGDPKVYVVQTATKVIERCLLMTTDPGDLIVDPTCGSGTSAYVAEQWGRRWITIDTSRVAIVLARQRLMTARFPYYLLADSAEGAAKERSLGTLVDSISTAHRNDLRQGFVYDRAPHITLKSIANNPDIHEGMTPAKIEAAIGRHAEVEHLYDRPYEDKNKVRVSGRFTVESLSPHRSASFDAAFSPGDNAADSARPSGGYEVTIVDNLRTAGVQNGRKRERLLFTAIDPHPGSFVQYVAAAASQADVEAAREVSAHAEPATRRVAICLGPEYGTVDARMVNPDDSRSAVC